MSSMRFLDVRLSLGSSRRAARYTSIYRSGFHAFFHSLYINQNQIQLAYLKLSRRQLIVTHYLLLQKLNQALTKQDQKPNLESSSAQCSINLRWKGSSERENNKHRPQLLLLSSLMLKGVHCIYCMSTRSLFSNLLIPETEQKESDGSFPVRPHQNPQAKSTCFSNVVWDLKLYTIPSVLFIPNDQMFHSISFNKQLQFSYSADHHPPKFSHQQLRIHDSNFSLKQNLSHISQWMKAFSQQLIPTKNLQGYHNHTLLSIQKINHQKTVTNLLSTQRQSTLASLYIYYTVANKLWRQKRVTKIRATYNVINSVETLSTIRKNPILEKI